MLCSDMVLAGLNYGWYSRMVDYQATDFTNISNYKPWRYYRIVLSSNQIEVWGNDFIPETDEAKHIMGQAKAMWLCLFYLAQLSKG
jgi:hypothetical protein